MLSNETISWFSYEDKQFRPIKVIVKNLHHSWDNQAILNDLKEQGFRATNAINKLKWKIKEPLYIFMLTFDTSEDIKKVFEIKSILNTIVKVDPLKSSKLIPQCKKCQGFGHTKNFCGRPPKCVKCAGMHATIDCSKSVSEKPKCCSCGEPHPANYRGCVVAKELQKLRSKKLTQTSNPIVPVQTTHNSGTRKNQPKQNTTYARVA